MRQPHVYRSTRSKRYVYWFAYSDGDFRKGRREPPFAVWRDALAAHHLRGALRHLGFEDGGEIFNYPAKSWELIPVDLRRFRRHKLVFRRDDLILLCTRPPMDELMVDARKQIPESNTLLEARLFKALRWVFKTCSRTEIILTDEAAALKPSIAQRQSISFKEMGSAEFTAMLEPATRKKVKRDKANPRTIAYLVYLKHAWRNGPALLAAFSMGSNDTLIWSYLLATKHRDLLCSRRLVLAEMKTDGWPLRPTSMRFADSWPCRIVADVKPPPKTPLRAIG